ncbi:hypothetical protein CYPRO_0892 [Cyclonatronum proteinivorum]|uniref:Uncharacterized protein n=1 Tax=Cyclonatronum proteinivorum TaxID=1457365 RepID=A0A345UI67_9BACT|nr:hypothetical protein [Cyclonatronum proteinivorum]AXJ00169.1 hypothetical protein CYPRO_0892 [Cyclonatronum proteinivorum]
MSLPNLHKQAMAMKNKRRLRLDGGRAWIKNGQLHDAVKSASLKIERNPAFQTEETKALPAPKK